MEHNVVTPWDANINKFLFQMNRGSTLVHILFNKVISFCVGVDVTGEGGQGAHFPIIIFLYELFSCYSFQVTWLGKLNNGKNPVNWIFCVTVNWEKLCGCLTILDFLWKFSKSLVLAWGSYKSQSHDPALLLKDD